MGNNVRSAASGESIHVDESESSSTGDDQFYEDRGLWAA